MQSKITTQLSLHIDNHGRSNNLRIRGLPEEEGAVNIKLKAVEIFNFILGANTLTPSNLDHAHRALRPKDMANPIPRDIICYMHNLNQKEDILRSARKIGAVVYQDSQLQISQMVLKAPPHKLTARYAAAVQVTPSDLQIPDRILLTVTSNADFSPVISCANIQRLFEEEVGYARLGHIMSEGKIKSLRDITVTFTNSQQDHYLHVQLKHIIATLPKRDGDHDSLTPFEMLCATKEQPCNLISDIQKILLGLKHTTKPYFVRCWEEDCGIILTDAQPYLREYINVRVFLFTLEKLNNDTAILPNITLGYHLYDSCLDTRKAVKSVLQIISGPGRTVPNYSCSNHGKLAGFIGDRYSSTTIAIAQILGVYSYTQISYGATDFSLSDRQVYPHFFRMLHNDRVYYFIIAKLLRYFGWTWVGIFETEDGNIGNQESIILSRYLMDQGICVAYTIQRQAVINNNIKSIRDIVKQSSAQVIVLCGPFTNTVMITLSELKDVFHSKTFILPPSWASDGQIFLKDLETFNGSLSVESYPSIIYGTGNYFDDIRPSKFPTDRILEDFWFYKFSCFSANASKNIFAQKFYHFSLENCTGQEKLNHVKSYLFIGTAPRVDLAVNVLAQALNNMTVGVNDYEKEQNMNRYRHQLRHSLYNKPFRLGPWNPKPCFTKHGEHVTPNMILNWRSKSFGNVQYEIVGIYTPWALQDQKIRMFSKMIKWKTSDNMVPISRCSEPCLPGQRKMPTSGIHSCCYNCVQCSEGEISNVTDSENCIKCPDNEWPNERKDRCIPKLVEFLSYTDGALATVLASGSIVFCIIAVIILGLVITHWDTPIVKANNRNLSFILLVSILLSFLCVFLFLGRPVAITCMLRQVSFGIIFSVAVSSHLAKTIMVYIAFKATKPGSMWKKWLGMKLSNSIVFFCSSVQIIISISWLATYPPYQEQDTHSSQGTIIIQCNEGSVFAFYSVLGYMGLLAAVSFIIAFLARTLPDSFNEAKYITFSMLVFCSVWIAMIPAYLSTKGKYMVAVEVFAILASSAGLLGCIFFPKCYMILFRPEMNTKNYIFQNS
ncbi:vomeronasal type-2 receptor 26-like [Pelodytes ibericus]